MINKEKWKRKKKENILNFLKRGLKSATEISVYTRINYYKINDLLIDLIKEGKIENIDAGKNKYYKLKEIK